MTNLDYDEKTLQEIITQNCVLNEENAELQKQVDELKVLIQDMEQGYYLITQLRENMEKEKEQAVKDKAKELAQHLYDMKDLYWDEKGVNPQVEIRLDPQKFKRICEYYFGVEVE